MGFGAKGLRISLLISGSSGTRVAGRAGGTYRWADETYRWGGRDVPDARAGPCPTTADPNCFDRGPRTVDERCTNRDGDSSGGRGRGGRRPGRLYGTAPDAWRRSDEPGRWNGRRAVPGRAHLTRRRSRDDCPGIGPVDWQIPDVNTGRPHRREGQPGAGPERRVVVLETPVTCWPSRRTGGPLADGRNRHVPGLHTAPPMIANDTVYVGAYDGNLYLRPGTGEQYWARPPGDAIGSSPDTPTESSTSRSSTTTPAAGCSASTPSPATSSGRDQRPTDHPTRRRPSTPTTAGRRRLRTTNDLYAWSYPRSRVPVDVLDGQGHQGPPSPPSTAAPSSALDGNVYRVALDDGTGGVVVRERTAW